MIGMLAGLVLGVVRGVRFRSRGRPGAMASGEAEVYYDALTGGMRFRTESADSALSGSGGSGTMDHAALSSNLAWATSGHTGTASRLAGFGGGGATAYYQIGVDVQAYSAYLAGLAGASQSITADTTITTQRAHLISDGSWAITLPTVASWTIGVPTLITYDGTTEATIEIVPNAADKVNGSTRAALVGTRIVATLTPVAANKFTLTVQSGRMPWVHADYDLTAAAGASPWTIGGSTFTDISSASSSYAASSGLVATAKTSSLYTSSATADCAVCKTPFSGVVDAWSRPLSPLDRFWVCLQTSKTTTVGGSSPNVMATIGGTALSTVPRMGANNSTFAAVASIIARDSGSRSENTTAASFTASGWICMLWDGPNRRVADIICSSSPSGNPGASGGWWPLDYALRNYSFGQDYWGAPWLINDITDIHMVQTNGTTGSKFTHTHLTIIREEVGAT